MLISGWQRRIFIFGALGYYKFGALLEGRSGRSHIFRLRLRSCSEIFKPDPGPTPKNVQIWESDSCSDSGYHRCNRHSAMFILRICHIWKPSRFLLLKMKSDSESGSGFSQIFDFGSGAGTERKTQDPAGVDSGTPDPWLQIFNGANC